MLSMNQSEAKIYRWSELPREKLSDQLERTMVTGDRVMVAHIYLKQGAVVPLHQHDNEQMSYMIEGSLRFWLKTDDGPQLVVKAGEVLHLPSNLPHGAEALEDSVSIDIFSPPREDWLNKTDDYLRG